MWSIELALLVFVALIFVQSFLVLHKDRVSTVLQLRFADHLRTSLYAAISRASWSFLAGRHSGELSNVLTSEVQRVGTGTYFLLRFFTVSVLALAYLAVALWLSTWLTSLALVIGAALWILLHGSDNAAKQSGVMLSNASNRLFGLIHEFLSAMKLIKIHGEESSNLRCFSREVTQVSEHFIEFRQVNTRVQAVYRVGGAVALAVITYAALVWFKLPAAHLLLMTAIFARMLPQIAELQNGRQQLMHMLPAFAAWNRLMDACAANLDPVVSDGKPVPLLHGIEFDRVGFSHSQSHHRLSIERLAIPAGKTTALVGVSGSGKTTLLDLLSGLLSPDNGMILIDGVPLQQLPGWRKSIAYIPQETLIQNGSIRDNLVWGNDVADETEVARALSQSALAEFVKRLPRGLDTEVGERGVKLSGGERQRLALARALLRRPQLLVLDEAISALDTRSHQMVLDAIRALHGDMTILIVTHRHEEFAGLIDGMVRVDRGEVGGWQPVASLKSAWNACEQ